jgi:molybdopterin-binding protein
MNGVNLEVIITLKASLEMNLEVGDEVVALIRETEISILG